MSKALHDLTVAELARGLNEKQFSAVELAQHFLRRIEHDSSGSFLTALTPNTSPTGRGEQIASPLPVGEGSGVRASTYTGNADLECDVLVLGGGPGGYSAAFRAADLGLKVVIVERYATLGGVCLNVGCIPSKALLHVAAVMDEVSHMADLGVSFGKPQLDIDKLRGHKEKVIAKLTGGLGAMAKMRKVTVVRGLGQFVGSHHLKVEETTGSGQDKIGRAHV